MIIKSAEFVISNTDYNKCPQDNKPEYAFIGRSNVGKSSLINMLSNRKNLAMTSSKPGKTMLINHFIINNEWYLVDLPGYGYAQRGKKERGKFKSMIHEYISKRSQLINLFVLIDSRHEPQAIDTEFIVWLGDKEVPFSIVFTKIDKLSKSKLTDNINAYKKKLLESWEELPPIFITSSEKKIGGEDILKYIDEINISINE